MGGVTRHLARLHAQNACKKLVLCSTGAKIGTADAWGNRIEAVRRNGTKIHRSRHNGALVYHQLTETASRKQSSAIQKTLANTNNKGYIPAAKPLRDADFRDQVRSIFPFQRW